MNGGSAARTTVRFGLGQAHAAPNLPVTLRWREDASLSRAIGRSLLEPDFTHANDADARRDGGETCLFLASTTLLGLQPAYAVAVVDQEGRLRFKETLQFRFAAARGYGPGHARPAADAAPRLERLGALLADQIVYVPDELAAELDGLRDPLSGALRIHSSAPCWRGEFARRARERRRPCRTG